MFLFSSNYIISIIICFIVSKDGRFYIYIRICNVNCSPTILAWLLLNTEFIIVRLPLILIAHPLRLALLLMSVEFITLNWQGDEPSDVMTLPHRE